MVNNQQAGHIARATGRIGELTGYLKERAESPRPITHDEIREFYKEFNQMYEWLFAATLDYVEGAEPETVEKIGE